MDSSSPRPRSLAPREHGAYGQLGLPMLAALGSGEPEVVAALLSVSAWALFLAHEPLLVLLGRRGERLQVEQRPRVMVRLAALVLVGAVLGVAALALSSSAVRSAVVLPVILGAAFGTTLALGQERSLVGEGLAALALAGVSSPVAIAAGLTPGAAARAWCVWALGFGALLVPVRSIGARRREGSSPWTRVFPVLLALVTALALLRTGFGLGHLLALGPLLAAAAWFAIAPPPPRSLPRVGWTVVVAGLLTAVCLILVTRCSVR
ncbi:MAG: YwiC-like family protein [Myxococcaceae bacterium]